MQIFIIFVLMISALVEQLQFLQIQTRNDSVLKLTKSNLIKATGLHDKIAIFFYFGKSKNMESELMQFQNIAKELRENNQKITLASYDYRSQAHDDDFIKKFKLSAYNNQIIYIRDTIVINQIPSNQTYQQTLNFLLQYSLKNKISNIYQGEKMTQTRKFVVVLFTNNRTSTDFIVYTKLVRDDSLNYYNDIEYAYTFNDTVTKYLNQSIGSLVIYRQFDERIIQIPFEINLENYFEIQNLIELKSQPIIKSIDLKIYERVLVDHNKCIMLLEGIYFSDQKNIQQKNQLAIEAFKQAIPHFQNELYVMIANISQSFQFFQSLVQLVNLQQEINENPILLILAPEKDHYFKKFVMPTDDITDMQKIIQFYNKFKNKELKPTLKSEPPYMQSFQDNILYLVGKNYQKTVRDSTKDVLVNYYSSSCPRSMNFNQTFIAFAKAMVNNKNILIVNFEIKKNEFAGKLIEKYPTQRLFRRGQRPLDLKYGTKEPTFQQLVDFSKNYTTFQWVDLYYEKDEL